MAAESKRVKHLHQTPDGLYHYRRRVPPDLVKAIGQKEWWRATGTRRFDDAVEQVVEFRKVDDALIKRLRSTPEAADDHRAERRVQEHQAHDARGGEKFGHLMQRAARGDFDDSMFGRPDPARLPPTWRDAEAVLREALRLNPIEGLDRLKRFRRRAFDEEFKPNDPFDAESWAWWLSRLDSKITDLTASTPRISMALERYLIFREPAENTVRKFSAHIADLIKDVGDLPLTEVTAHHLRQHRDELRKRDLDTTSIRAHFVAIRSVFRHAVDEGLIPLDPTSGVKMPKEKQSADDRRWKQFTPAEMRMILAFAEEWWGAPRPGITTERRVGLLILIKTLAYTAMRPSEIMDVTPEMVTPDSIAVPGTKTAAAKRAIPLHPKAREFHDWIHAGGMDAFADIQTDRARPLRQNFAKLLQRLPTPIEDPKKSLYSLRGTFNESLRVIGAPPEIRRAILGHAERDVQGRHYANRPSVSELRRWVEAADPTIDPLNFELEETSSK